MARRCQLSAAGHAHATPNGRHQRVRPQHTSPSSPRLHLKFYAWWRPRPAVHPVILLSCSSCSSVSASAAPQSVLAVHRPRLVPPLHSAPRCPRPRPRPRARPRPRRCRHPARGGLVRGHTSSGQRGMARDRLRWAGERAGAAFSTPTGPAWARTATAAVRGRRERRGRRGCLSGTQAACSARHDGSCVTWTAGWPRL